MIINRDDTRKAEVLTPQEIAGSEENRVFYGFFHQSRHFVDCIKLNQAPETCFRDAL